VSELGEGIASEADESGVSSLEELTRRGKTRARHLPGSSEQALPAPRVTVIRPLKRMPLLDLRELWHFRELGFIFVWRDLKVRYKQTAVGVGWVLLQPIATVLIFTLFLGRFAKVPTNGLPYPIFILSGLLPMTLFQSAVSQSSASVVAATNLVTKVYFPRVLLPLAAAIVPLVDLFISLSLLVGLMYYYSMFPGAAIAAVPFALVLALVAALGLGLFLSAVYVRYRDVPFAIPFFLQILPWVSGVYLALNTLEEKYQWLLAVNPMSSAVAIWRWAMLGTVPPPDPGKVALSCAVAVAMFSVGLVYFKRSEPRFADTI
jgi:lipopolysaccharide transport system permease protein